MTLRNRTEALTAFVEDRAGGLFVGTVAHTESSHDLISVTDHVREAYDEATVETLVELLRDHQAVSADAQYPTIPAGELQTAVYVLENAIVLHYTLGDTDGVAVALDQAAGQNLFRFVSGPDSISNSSPMSPHLSRTVDRARVQRESRWFIPSMPPRSV